MAPDGKMVWFIFRGSRANFACPVSLHQKESVFIRQLQESLADYLDMLEKDPEPCENNFDINPLQCDSNF